MHCTFKMCKHKCRTLQALIEQISNIIRQAIGATVFDNPYYSCPVASFPFRVRHPRPIRFYENIAAAVCNCRFACTCRLGSPFYDAGIGMNCQGKIFDTGVYPYRIFGETEFISDGRAVFRGEMRSLARTAQTLLPCMQPSGDINYCDATRRAY